MIAVFVRAGDTIDLPPASVRLFTDELRKIPGFQKAVQELGDSVMGVKDNELIPISAYAWQCWNIELAWWNQATPRAKLHYVVIVQYYRFKNEYRTIIREGLPIRLFSPGD